MTINKYAPIAALTDTDAYKLGHIKQYPAGTEFVLSNFTPRKSRDPEITHVVNFGLQYFIKSWIEAKWKPFFEADEQEVVDLYTEFVTSVLGPEAAEAIGSDHIRALHQVGYLPLRFRALPEGVRVPLRVPLFTVENTQAEFFWLTNYIETALSAVVWHPGTSATTADRYRTLLNEWAIKTTGSTAGVSFQGHDFSFRGMEGIEAAAASGAGHLLSFTGSDNLNSINFVNEYYPGENGLILASVPATEHSVMCAGGAEPEQERETYRRLIEEVHPAGFVSIVSDTWDFWHVLTDTIPSLKDSIMSRDGRVVIRPDSGDPVDIITGTLTDEERASFDDAAPREYTPEEKGAIEVLWETFGGTVTEQGYKLLDTHIGLIYGDSITYERAKQISERLAAKGFATTNVVYGIGSYTYQYVTRDTFGSAMKATWVQINGEQKAIWKDPKTDNGTKKSARGRIAVVWEDGDYKLVDDSEVYMETGTGMGTMLENGSKDMLKTVWEDGQFRKEFSYDEVRQNLHPEGLL